jgi:hypothetical protein
LIEERVESLREHGDLFGNLRREALSIIAGKCIWKKKKSYEQRSMKTPESPAFTGVFKRSLGHIC